MTREELLAALDIVPETQVGPLYLDDETTTTQPHGPPPSPTALELDDWSLRRGAESLEGDILGPILSGQDPESSALAAADCLAAAFEPCPRLAENCADETRGRYFRQLIETQEYQALHSQTQLDVCASELAGGHFAQGYLTLLGDEQKQEAQEGTQNATGTPGDKARSELKKELRALSAASQALQKATRDVDDLRDAQRALGDDPSNPKALDPSALKARFDRIRNSQRLRAIIENTGRYMRLAQSRQRQKTRHGQDDVVGVELGNDLGRLLPSELAALGDPDLELDALRRYLERGLMQRDYRGVEHKAKGPIVAVIDESGSMEGPKIEMAKAIALTFAWIARYQHRYCCLVGFSDDSEGSWHVIPPGKSDQDGLLAWLEHMYNGGTSPEVPLETLPARWEQIGAPRGQTDIILLTDGCLRISDAMRDNFNRWKVSEKAKLYTLIIGEDSPGDLAEVSDRAWCLPDLSIEQDAIQQIVSI